MADGTEDLDFFDSDIEKYTKKYGSGTSDIEDTDFIDELFESSDGSPVKDWSMDDINRLIDEVDSRDDVVVQENRITEARAIQDDCLKIIQKLCSGHGNMYGMIKEVLRINHGLDCGSVRAPLAELIESDYPIAREAAEMIKPAIAKYC